MISNVLFLLAKKISLVVSGNNNKNINYRFPGNMTSGNGGGGGFKKNLNFFAEEPDRVPLVSLFCFLLKENNFNEKYTQKNNKQKDSVNTTLDEIILKNCEQIPENFFNEIYQNLFFQYFPKENAIKKSKKFINNWYLDRNFDLSKIKYDKNCTKVEKISYIFQIKEPKVKSFKYFSEVTGRKKKFSKIGKLETRLLSNILDISVGKIFKLNSSAWKRIKSLKGTESSDFTLKDQSLGDFGDFFDVTIKIKKMSSLAIEPEISLVNNQISSSINFTEKNFLGTGILIKQKIFLKKLSPYFIKFEIDDKGLIRNQNLLIIGKYLRDFYSISFALKKFSNENRTSFIKMKFNSECQFSKKNGINRFGKSFIQTSFSLSKVNFLKPHSFFSFFSVSNSQKLTKNNNNLILNSMFESTNELVKLDGLLCSFENRLSYKNSFKKFLTEKSMKDTKKYILFDSKVIYNIPVTKSIRLNTILSKHLKVILDVKFKKKNKILSNSLKKIEFKFETGNLFSLSFQITNFGKVRGSIN